MTNKTLIHRRTFLRGAGGVALSLPLLECMAADAEVEVPKRFLGLYIGHGFSLGGEWSFYPIVVDGEMRFSKSMAAFNPLAEHVTVLRGLEHPGCVSAGGHQTGDSFLTGSHVNRAAKSPSFDQIASMTHGHKTRYPSLVLGNEGGMGSVGNTKTLSYNRFGSPIPASNDIRGLFDAMFNSDPQLQKGQRSRLASDKHRLDHVLESYHGLKRQLGRNDSQKLDQYMQALRDGEKEIQRMQRWMATPKPQVPSDGLALNASEKDPAAFIRTMYNLIYLAFKTDSTRYATYMLQSMNAEWGKISLALGLGPGHHVLAHNATLGGGHLEKLGKYDKFQADLLAEFITKLADTPEGEGTMLDNTIVLYGSSNSQTHVNTNYPLMLVGGEKLGLRQGALQDFGKKKPPLSNLYLTLLNALNVPARQFSDSSGTITEMMV